MKLSKIFSNKNTFRYDYNWNEYILRNQHGVALQSYKEEYIESLTEDELSNLYKTFENDKR